MSRLRSTGKSAARPTRLRVCWRSALDDYVSALDWSPDGKRVAAASVSGPVFVFEGEGAVLRRSAGHGFRHHGASLGARREYSPPADRTAKSASGT